MDVCQVAHVMLILFCHFFLNHIRPGTFGRSVYSASQCERANFHKHLTSIVYLANEWSIQIDAHANFHMLRVLALHCIYIQRRSLPLQVGGETCRLNTIYCSLCRNQHQMLTFSHEIMLHTPDPRSQQRMWMALCARLWCNKHLTSQDTPVKCVYSLETDGNCSF